MKNIFIFSYSQAYLQVNGKSVSNLGKELTFLPMEMCLVVLILMENLLERENTFGQMAVRTLEILRMASNMGKVNGRKEKESKYLFMKENM